MKRKFLNILLALPLLFSGEVLHAQERGLSLAEALTMAAKGNKGDNQGNEESIVAWYFSNGGLFTLL
jgi:hypothetical protein